MSKKKSTILRKIKIGKHNFDLEIYPNLEGHEEITWEIFPRTHEASLYAFSNKDKIDKIVKKNYIYEPKKK
jgi:hypothetical protein|tara:strand:+ start:342 stop:554 length:213 start_codon:yes stop_codon:yes gene_type:complete